MKTKKWSEIITNYIKERLSGGDRVEILKKLDIDSATKLQIEQLMFIDFLVTFHPHVAKGYLHGTKEHKEILKVAINAWQTRARIAEALEDFENGVKVIELKITSDN